MRTIIAIIILTATVSTVAAEPLNGASSKEEFRCAHQVGTRQDGTPYWLDHEVPYHLNYQLNEDRRNRVLEAVARWNKQAGSVIQWVPRTSRHTAWIEFREPVRCVQHGGCFHASWQRSGVPDGVGYIEAQPHQFSMQTLLHEMGHAVGMGHEFERPDRDRYMVLTAEAAAKQPVDPDQNTDTPFDYQSIMHYTELAASSESVPDGVPIGRSDRLSVGDVERLRRMYRDSARFDWSTRGLNDVMVTSNPEGMTVLIDGTPCETPCIFPSGLWRGVDAIEIEDQDGWRFVRWNNDIESNGIEVNKHGLDDGVYWYNASLRRETIAERVPGARGYDLGSLDGPYGRRCSGGWAINPPPYVGYEDSSGVTHSQNDKGHDFGPEIQLEVYHICTSGGTTGPTIATLQGCIGYGNTADAFGCEHPRDGRGGGFRVTYFATLEYLPGAEAATIFEDGAFRETWTIRNAAWFSGHEAHIEDNEVLDWIKITPSRGEVGRARQELEEAVEAWNANRRQ